MNIAILLITNTVQTVLTVLQICMLVRAVLSWFPLRDDNPLVLLVCMVTEPLLAPIRALFDRMGWFRNSPIDVSFFAGVILLSLVSTLTTMLL